MGGVAQQLRTHTILAEDPSSIPCTHIWLLTSACNSSYRGSYTLFWLPRASLLSCTLTHTDACMLEHAHTHTHTRYINKSKVNLKNASSACSHGLYFSYFFKISACIYQVLQGQGYSSVGRGHALQIPSKPVSQQRCFTYIED